MPIVRWMAWSEPAELDSTRIAPRLHIGSAPPTGDAVRRHGKRGFDVLVLCAGELTPHQPDRAFPGVRVIRVPMMDSDDIAHEWPLAERAAREALRAHRAGKRVLVTCAQGRNRSGLVIAIMLHELTGWSGREVVAYIRSVRRGALMNSAYVRRLYSLQPKQRQRLAPTS